MNKMKKNAPGLQKWERVILLVGKAQSFNQLMPLLKAKKNKVILSQDSTDAFEILQSNNIDLIITQLLLPTMDCLEFIVSLNELHLNTPLIIITHHTKEISDNLSLLSACAVSYTMDKGKST